MVGKAQVRINEVLAVNRTAFSDAGAFPGYVELYNAGTNDVNISRWRISDDVSNISRAYIFPNNTIIQAQSYLMVFCDLNTNTPGFHTGFDLSPQGEVISLFSAALEFRDHVTFGFQVADHSIGRHPEGTGPFQLGLPSPGARNNVITPLGSRSSLRINEWMANVAIPNAPNDDWFELYNSDSQIVNISGCVWTDQNHIPVTNGALRQLSFIAPRSFLRFFADDIAPAVRPDNVDFKLSSTLGDQIMFFESNRTTQIMRVAFPPQRLNIAQGCLPDGNTNNIVDFPPGRATPGESNYLPIENVRINEVLTKTARPEGGAIELYNDSGFWMDLSGWYLSDSRQELQKYAIPAGAPIEPFGFLVFNESAGSPLRLNFKLDPIRGGEVILSSVDRYGQLDGYRHAVDFEAASKEVSFGRYYTSVGEPDFTRMSRATIGDHNAEPLIAPVVITEIMYHPPDIINGTSIIDNTFDEYIEVYNRSGSEVRLFDANRYAYHPNAWTNTWRIDGDARFQFPTNIVLLPGESVVVVSSLTPFQIQAFRAKYRVPTGTRIFGPYAGDLANGDGNVRLLAPEPPEPPESPDAGAIPYAAVDKVKYYDNEHRSYWPREPDGQRFFPLSPNSVGYALSRKRPEEYGNDVANWAAAYPSPGMQRIQVEPIYIFGNTVAIRFHGWAGSSYSVERSSNLIDWSKLADFPMQPTSGPRHLAEILPTAGSSFYRVVSPMR